MASPTKATRFDALLLAAGKGSRLEPLTKIIPKCLCPVAGEPILGFWIQKLISAGADNIWINGHYHAHMVTHYLKQRGWWNRIHWRYEPHLLGTGGTLRTVLAETRARAGERPLLVIHADNYSHIDLKQFAQTHVRQTQLTSSLATMALFLTDRPELCGIVTHDQQGMLTGFTEKPKHANSRMANAAIYFIEPKKLLKSNINLEAISDISLDLIPQLIHRAYTYLHRGLHIDIGNIPDYAQALLSPYQRSTLCSEKKSKLPEAFA